MSESTRYKQRNFLREYIAQGLFMHDEKQSATYDRIQQEEIMADEDAERKEIEVDQDSSDEDESESDNESPETEEKIAKKRKERMELRLIDELGKEQGVLRRTWTASAKSSLNPLDCR